MRVAVTGASGFVGGAVCRHLRDHGWTVVGFGRRPGPWRRWDVTTGPLADPPAVDAVVHAAAWVGDTGPFGPAFAVNVTGTAHVLASFPGARIVHVSSASVHHPHRPQVLAAESEAPDPRGVRWPGPYGPTKSLAERLVLTRRPDAVVLRPHAVYGPGDTTLLPRVLGAVRRGVLMLPGPGDQRHALTRVESFAESCRRVLEGDPPGGVYHVTDAEPVVLAQVLAQALAERGVTVRVRAVGRRPALAAAGLAEAAHRSLRRPGAPLLSRYAAGHLALERTYDLARLREALSWTPPPTTMADAATW